MSNSCEIAPRWMAQTIGTIDGKSTLGDVRAWCHQQATTWTNIDPDLCCYMASLGHNELTLHIFSNMWMIISCLHYSLSAFCITVWLIDPTYVVMPLKHWNGMLPFWWNFHHLLHQKLSFWQLSVQPVMKMSFKWQKTRIHASSQGINEYDIDLVYVNYTWPYTAKPIIR